MRKGEETKGHVEIIAIVACQDCCKPEGLQSSLSSYDETKAREQTTQDHLPPW